MASGSGIVIVVGEAYGGNGESFHISPRAMATCSFLGALLPGSHLPDTPPEPFRIALRYLDGRDADLQCIQPDDGVLLLFAQTWALAAKLNLPDLQNKLIDRLKEMYIQACRRRDDGLYANQHRPSYHADSFLAMAFQHLEAQCGLDSCAERFLVCFVARLAQDIAILRTDLSLHEFGERIREKILDQARALTNDPIRYDIRQFKVTASARQEYEPPTVYPPSGQRTPRSVTAPPSSHTIPVPQVTIHGIPNAPGPVVLRNPRTVAWLTRALRLQDPTVEKADTNSIIPSLRGGAASETHIPRRQSRAASTLHPRDSVSGIHAPTVVSGASRPSRRNDRGPLNKDELARYIEGMLRNPANDGPVPPAPPYSEAPGFAASSGRGGGSSIPRSKQPRQPRVRPSDDEDGNRGGAPPREPSTVNDQSRSASDRLRQRNGINIRVINGNGNHARPRRRAGWNCFGFCF